MTKAALILAAVLAMLAAPCARAEGDKLPVAAPAWKLLDTEGKVVTSAQFKGKVVILDFWATWCVPCRTEIPGYIRLQSKYGPEGLVVIGVSVDTEGTAVVRKFMKDMGVNYLVLMSDDDILTAFNPPAYPTTYVIDRDGLIRSRKVGRMPPAEFEKKVLAVLRPPAP
jgi:thiol-disulfide isomerase/thioredoxin